MKGQYRRIRRYVIGALFVILSPLGLVFLYLVYAVGMLFTEVSGNSSIAGAGSEIFVHSNGFHTDILVPAYDSLTGTAWMQSFHEQGLDTLFKDCRYIAFGWGEKDFYMESFDKPFPSLSTTLRAVFLPNPALMHIEFKENTPSESAGTVKIFLTGEQYKKLGTYISSFFEKDPATGNWAFFRNGYGPDDFFYKAKGSYHLFHTCNDWTNDGLKAAQAPHALKAPFAENILLAIKNWF